jgi:[ribosomal protein S5]-alanine N-acetyltransferase
MTKEKADAVILGKIVYLRFPRLIDSKELIELNKLSDSFHKGLVNPPKDQEAFEAFFQKNETPANESLLICETGNDLIAGAINLSQIFRAGFQNAYLGYYLGEKFAGRGFGTEAIALIVKFAFDKLNLHRLEANIQPHNFASIAVVKKNGFTKEGFSKDYLQIEGEWRDHERWAIVNDNWKNE